MKTHFNRIDNRLESLNITFKGLEVSITYLRQKSKQIEWYDAGWFAEEAEPIYGLAFICLQNYINSSIKDRFEIVEKRFDKYKIGAKNIDYQRTDIELIIAIANYFKHKDDNRGFHNGTKNILNDFNIKFEKGIDVLYSPIFESLNILTENWELNELSFKVSKWREQLWLKDKTPL